MSDEFELAVVCIRDMYREWKDAKGQLSATRDMLRLNYGPTTCKGIISADDMKYSSEHSLLILVLEALESQSEKAKSRVKELEAELVQIYKTGYPDGGEKRTPGLTDNSTVQVGRGVGDTATVYVGAM